MAVITKTEKSDIEPPVDRWRPFGHIISGRGGAVKSARQSAHRRQHPAGGFSEARPSISLRQKLTRAPRRVNMHGMANGPATDITIPIRVRYPECDAMGYLHHSRYFQYFEVGRVELLRQGGHSYADLEKEGIFFVVVKAECSYRAPARFDDVLNLTTRINRHTAARIDHAYKLMRDTTLIAEAATTIACVDRTGQLTAIPDWIMNETE
jgi:acyl-CoA thioester hydrolase